MGSGSAERGAAQKGGKSCTGVQWESGPIEGDSWAPVQVQCIIEIYAETWHSPELLAPDPRGETFIFFFTS